MKIYLTLSLVLILFSFRAAAEDVVSISTTVKGNQEHPSVTYIIPWRQASDESALTMPFETRTRLGDVFEHVERAEHEREVSYLVQMKSAPQAYDIDSGVTE
ncbi:hypothetical protein [Marinagarivorans cellulosilyticus]|uniref:Uncharacterized protein n=1 Tax=Marinagarivorans cellulosilyticus TaxID=2721545 RepID=A0AAN1WK85_9GAMM|nr:hypothetical protein [Marinagarivorans cellulosilyticus]BCD99095.1 hypothetical protein MARGE09_P3296 [Marinagarivorans cellulosilyticus]